MYNNKTDKRQEQECQKFSIDTLYASFTRMSSKSKYSKDQKISSQTVSISQMRSSNALEGNQSVPAFGPWRPREECGPRPVSYNYGRLPLDCGLLWPLDGLLKSHFNYTIHQPYWLNDTNVIQYRFIVFVSTIMFCF